MKILIADDEIEIVDVLRKYLEAREISIDYVLDGEKALQLIKKKNYDIIFLDINMPGLTGIEILRYVKDGNIKAKVVFLTGYPCITEDFAKALRADEYLVKPISLKVIGKIVDKYMRG